MYQHEHMAIEMAKKQDAYRVGAQGVPGQCVEPARQSNEFIERLTARALGIAKLADRVDRIADRMCGPTPEDPKPGSCGTPQGGNPSFIQKLEMLHAALSDFESQLGRGVERIEVIV